MAFWNNQRVLAFKDTPGLQGVEFVPPEEMELTRQLFGGYCTLVPRGYTPLLVPNSALDVALRPDAGPPREEPRIPRPPNAFILFRKDTQQQVRKQHRHLPNKEISRIIAAKYAGLSPAEKKVYTDRAQLALDLHRQTHPDYKFRPVASQGSKRPRVPATDNPMREFMGCYDLAK